MLFNPAKYLSVLIIVLSLCFSEIVPATTGPYIGKVKLIQATSLGNPFNTIYLELDISDSPCASTNVHNRFTLLSDVQYGTALAALMAGNIIKIWGTGECVSDIEQINNMQIFPNR